MRTDDGAGSVIVLLAGVFVITLVTVATVIGAITLTRQQVQRAADLSALAAVSVFHSCTDAHAVARANAVKLTSCRAGDGSAEVEVMRHTSLRHLPPVRARARAEVTWPQDPASR
jgi:secretion/DNA translocation related TadE-like protein